MAITLIGEGYVLGGAALSLINGTSAMIGLACYMTDEIELAAELIRKGALLPVVEQARITLQ